MEIIAALGRLPDPTEFAGTQAVVERFRSLKWAFAVIRRITDADLWESIARRRREDMLVYLTLARFRKRPRLSQLPFTLQRDMKAFFGGYARRGAATRPSSKCLTVNPQPRAPASQRLSDWPVGERNSQRRARLWKEVLPAPSELRIALRIYEGAAGPTSARSRGTTSSKSRQTRSTHGPSRIY
jgi:DNA phosphorothioation-associated putative methyltransferase